MIFNFWLYRAINRYTLLPPCIGLAAWGHFYAVVLVLRLPEPSNCR